MSVVAILSDIHANLPALEAVLGDADHLGCEKIWSLGDQVGYGGSPNECLGLLRERDAVCVMGNHDAAVVNLEDAHWFNSYARAAVEWTRLNLTGENLVYLVGLPDSRVVGDHHLLVHGAPDNRSRYLYPGVDLLNEACLLEVSRAAEICFYGHTHLPMVSNQERVWHGNACKVDLSSNGPYFINPGSVGQPRDNNPDAAWLLLDTDAHHVEFRRVVYDIDRAERLIHEAGLPDRLAERLGCGQ